MSSSKTKRNVRVRKDNPFHPSSTQNPKSY
ncbi:predicted protein [Sclerotinia sclerotiorum 1980 UF-70]|uniref:Uncharacterized protein n=1 Tax=Sclerotinia sclerotiorum (strain ATCC 18683 / 1980 / Ss-1) TaxID=665079 RepID=A7E6J9_SCLS1|nr:predicted protein [Sclerotinia sclerotiorum 1980 UF-70]EDN91521.1 predicted protein [Sclerotinia sclerotiorum 1980 UF-70]